MVQSRDRVVAAKTAMRERDLQVCKFCKEKPEVIKQNTKPGGNKMRMYRVCCEKAAKGGSPSE